MDSADSSPSRTLEILCGRFEAAWKTTDSSLSRPRIQDFLHGLPQEDRSTAFCTLLALELKFRQALGEQPTAEDYFRLHPDATELIRVVFEDSFLGLRSPTSSISGREATIDYPLSPAEPEPDLLRQSQGQDGVG